MYVSKGLINGVRGHPGNPIKGAGQSEKGARQPEKGAGQPKMSTGRCMETMEMTVIFDIFHRESTCKSKI